MFRKVMIGVDGKPGGEDALALARQLVDKHGELILAYVYNDDIRTFTAGQNRAQEERDRATEMLDQVKSRSGIGKLVTATELHVGRGLHILAEQERADLLVIGSTQRGLLDRVMIGDATAEALNGAPCAIAIAPAGYADHPKDLERIGIGYDGSTEGHHALAVARKLSAEHTAKLAALEVLSVPTTFYYRVGGSRISLTGPWLDDARRRIEALGDIEPHVAVGEASEELAFFSRKVDLLVVGSRGYGPLGAIAYGSVSRRLARSCRCPLLVLTRGARVSDAESELTALGRVSA